MERLKKRKKSPKHDNLKLPYVYASQLCDYGNDEDDEDAIDVRSIYINEPMVVGYHGPKRGGKTASLSFAACMAMASGIKTYLNYPVSFYLMSNNGDKELKEAELLTLKKFIEMLDSMEHVFVGIDEYQWWASAYTHNSNLNKYIDRFLQQIAHCGVIFHYTAKSESWVDTITRFETDISIHCSDFYTEHPTENQKGENIKWEVKDKSGILTGKMYEEFPIKHARRLYFQPLKGCYNDKQRLDPWEGIGGLQIDKEKIVVGDGDNGHKSKLPPHEILKQQTLQLFQSEPRWKPQNFWQTMGISNPHEQHEVIERMQDWGIEVRTIRGHKMFTATNMGGGMTF